MEVKVRITDQVLPGQNRVLMVLPTGHRYVFVRDAEEPILEHECDVPEASIPALVYDGYEVKQGRRNVDLSKLNQYTPLPGQEAPAEEETNEEE